MNLPSPSCPFVPEGAFGWPARDGTPLGEKACFSSPASRSIASVRRFRRSRVQTVGSFDQKGSKWNKVQASVKPEVQGFRPRVNISCVTGLLPNPRRHSRDKQRQSWVRQCGTDTLTAMLLAHVPVLKQQLSRCPISQTWERYWAVSRCPGVGSCLPLCHYIRVHQNTQLHDLS